MIVDSISQVGYIMIYLPSIRVLRSSVASNGASRYLAAQGTCHQSNCTKVVPQGSITGFKDVSAKATGNGGNGTFTRGYISH